LKSYSFIVEYFKRIDLMRIFLIDDDIDDQELFIEAVRELNTAFSCDCASNGEEGLNYLLTRIHELPDLIFLDLNMPRLNGKQCLEKIKSVDRLKDVPVVIYSTSSQENDIRDTRNLGAVHFLTKPSSFKDLCTSLAEIFNKNNFPLNTNLKY
jgi:CheY-like chemotaxis protein